MKVRILLADDHRIMREGLRHLLEKEDGFEVVGEADNGETAVHLARELTPQVIIMDLSMPVLSGIEATRRLKASQGEVKILALSMHSDRAFVMEALDAGANGYLLKECAGDELIEAVHRIFAGEAYLCGKVAGVILDNLRRNQEAPATLDLLTKREREVFKYIASGLSTKEVAFSLNVSSKTIETQRMAIMRKLKLRNMTELIKLAIREGLTSLE